MATNQIVDLFDTLAWEDGSFITIEISATNVLQFISNHTKHLHIKRPPINWGPACLFLKPETFLFFRWRF